MNTIKLIITSSFIAIFLIFFQSLVTICIEGFEFLLHGFLIIPKIIIFDFFQELPNFLQYGYYSLFCIIIFITVFKIYCIFK